MSEKRFSFNGIYFVDNETGQMSHNTTEKTLNLLYDENEQLRQDHKRQENEIKMLRAVYSKIPPKIREVWKE